MGYTTYFDGEFTVTPPLSDEMRDYLHTFSRTRRMTRDPNLLADTPDPVREAVGLPLGDGAQYFVAGEGKFGDLVTSDVVDHNTPPPGQPGLWCQWVPTSDGDGIEHDGVGGFYEYDEWLSYLITHFLAPNGYTLNGDVHWEGEDSDDFGILTVHDNTVRSREGRREYAD